MFAAIKAWIIHLFHVHDWEEVGKGTITGHNGAVIGDFYEQRCRICKNMRCLNLK